MLTPLYTNYPDKTFSSFGFKPKQDSFFSIPKRKPLTLAEHVSIGAGTLIGTALPIIYFCKKQKVPIQKLKYASKNNSAISIIEGDSRKMQNIAEDSMDLILTSPPYGDSRTTVAYGQFSRLSMQWFGIKPIEGNELNLDNFLLGGKKDKLEDYEEVINKSLTLNSVYESFLYKSLVNKEDAKKYIDRLRDILSFYSDMDLVLNNASKYLKNNKHCIFVTGSRIVKNVKLHTDIIISELASHYGFDLKGIMYRDIDSKRIPSKISASNIKGDTAATMTKESIVILKLNI